jgi:magnesium transporter
MTPDATAPTAVNGADANGLDPNARYVIVVYNEQGIVAHECADVDAVLMRVDRQKVNWITVRDVHDEAELTKLLTYFEVDLAILPDIMDEGPLEFDTEYETCLYLEYIVPYLDETAQRLVSSGGSFILGNNFLIVYAHQLHGLFSRTRRLMLNRQTKAMQYGSDYLLYLLMRAFIVEHYHRVFKYLNGRLETLEDLVLISRGDGSAYQAIIDQREDIKPWSEPLLETEEFLEYVKDAESKFIGPHAAPLFAKSLYREIQGLLESYGRLRLWLKEIMDLQQANVERRTSRVNQLLTIVATIFLPLTFIASIYGMNFEHMPELSWRYGYPAVLLLMVLVAVSLVVFMKRRNWF